MIGARRLWLVVQENGSNVPEVLEPAWAQAEFVGPSGTDAARVTRTTRPRRTARGRGPVRVAGSNGDGVAGARTRRVLVYDIAGRGFTRFRGVIGLENPQSEIGSTLNPQMRFFVFDAAPNMERLLPPAPGTPLPSPARAAHRRRCDRPRVSARARPRAVALQSGRAAEAALRDPSGGSTSVRPWARRSAVGRHHEAGVSVDLLKRLIG